jgi:hypothetical protein
MVGVIDTIQKYNVGIVPPQKKNVGIVVARIKYLVKIRKLQNLLSKLPSVLLFKTV